MVELETSTRRSIAASDTQFSVLPRFLTPSGDHKQSYLYHNNSCVFIACSIYYKQGSAPDDHGRSMSKMKDE